MAYTMISFSLYPIPLCINLIDISDKPSPHIPSLPHTLLLYFSLLFPYSLTTALYLGAWTLPATCSEGNYAFIGVFIFMFVVSSSSDLLFHNNSMWCDALINAVVSVVTVVVSASDLIACDAAKKVSCNQDNHPPKKPFPPSSSAAPP